MKYEDLCAIPDLAAGMLSSISTCLVKGSIQLDRLKRVVESELQPKVEVIADWFWDTETLLRKTFISIDTDGPQFGVTKISMLRDS